MAVISRSRAATTLPNTVRDTAVYWLTLGASEPSSRLRIYSLTDMRASCAPFMMWAASASETFVVSVRLRPSRSEIVLMAGESGKLSQVTRDTGELSFAWADPLFSMTYAKQSDSWISALFSVVYQTSPMRWVSCEIFSDAVGGVGCFFASIAPLAISEYVY